MPMLTAFGLTTPLHKWLLLAIYIHHLSRKIRYLLLADSNSHARVSDN